VSWLSRLPIDRFLLAIIAAAALASVFPATGIAVDVVEWATTVAIAALFFLYGARLSPQETLAGLKHWRLHLLILAFTYLVFPLLGLGISTLGAAWSAQWSKRYSTRLSVSESDQRYETVPSPYLSKTRLRNVLLQNEWREGSHLFTAALERREDHLVNAPIDQGRHQNAIALGYGFSGGPHTLQVNLRHDRDSEFGGQSTGGVAYGYGFAPGWRATVAAGTSFRVPTLYQRFSEYGQPALQPEKGRNIELGLHWARGDSRFGITAYRNRVTNLIVFGAPGPCAGAFGCYENAGRARLQGVTVSGAHRLGAVNLAGSLDLQSPRNALTDKLLPRRAQRLLKLSADTRVAGWTLGAEWQAASHRWDNAANTRRLGGHGLVNLYASTTIARDWQLLARLDNLGDKSYQLARGYATPGRTLFVGLRWTPR